ESGNAYPTFDGICPRRGHQQSWPLLRRPDPSELPRGSHHPDECLPIPRGEGREGACRRGLDRKV
ncbi:MAG: hypothetical protein, partial [Olavius algarvensis Gamma 1 endosymbiont]